LSLAEVTRFDFWQKGGGDMLSGKDCQFCGGKIEWAENICYNDRDAHISCLYYYLKKHCPSSPAYFDLKRRMK